MTLTELKYIVTLAQEQHFGRAAKKCFVSQPTLSVAIKKFEESLDVIIFERRKNKVQITDIGQKIVQQAQQVLESAEKIKQLAKADHNPLQQTLRMGAIHTVGPYLFPHLIPAINKLAPDLSLIIEENYTAKLREKLANGELDIIIIALPFSSRQVKVLPIYRENFDVIIPAGHAWKNKKVISPDDFIDESVLLLGEGNCFRDQVLQACPTCALHAEPETRSEKMVVGSSLETIRYMVATGLGVSVLPRSATQQAYKNKLVLTKPFRKPEPFRDIALAYRESFTRPAVLDLLTQAINKMVMKGAELL